MGKQYLAWLCLLPVTVAGWQWMVFRASGNIHFSFQGEKDWQKYEVARRLKDVVDKIRSQYRADWKSREMKKRQRSVALYFIDKVPACFSVLLGCCL